MQLYKTMLGTVAPSIINLASVFLATASLDPVGTGEALMILAIFYIAIDAGNFGASRLILIGDFSANAHALRFLDCISGIISSIVFATIFISINELLITTLSTPTPFAFLTPFFYCLSHAALGVLRINSNNGAVALLLTFCSAVRLLFTFLHIKDLFTADDFLLGLLMVEGLQGLLFFMFSKINSQTASASAFISSSIEITRRNKAMIKASWLSNFTNGLAKHSDVFLIGILAGPSSVLLYRPIKSTINFVFNIASSLSIVCISGPNLNRATKFIKSRTLVACLLFFILSNTLLSLFVDSYWTAFVKDVSFEDAFLVIFITGICCLLVFFNRFLISMAVFLEANSVLTHVSLIEVFTLYSLFFFLVPFSGIFGAVISIFTSSSIAFIYSVHHIRRHMKIQKKSPT